MLNKVPEVTLYFWVIKVLCTTVGETAADYLNENWPGPDQDDLRDVRRAGRRARLPVPAATLRPGVYWLAVVLISIVGTLITDNLTDNFGVSLVTTTIVFAVLLAATFAVWYASERTLPSTRSSPRGARRSTGSRCCSRSRWGRRRAT